MQNIPKIYIKAWVLPVSIALVSLILQWLGWVELLRYERRAIEGGELWRIISGNIVHLGWSHFVMNVLGLGLIWALFSHTQSNYHWLADILFASLGVGIGLYWLNPGLHWYVGLSGVLHGMFIIGLLLDQSQSRAVFWLVLIGFIGKLLCEQFAGALPGSESVAGGAVVVDAHLYGTVGGLLILMVKKCSQFRRPNYSSS